MIVKVGFLVVATVATFAVSKINIDSSRKRNTTIKPSANDGSNFQQEGIKGEDEDKSADSNFSVEEKQEEEVGKKCRSEMKQEMKPNLDEKRDSEKDLIHGKKLDKDTETEVLKKIVNEVEQRKVTLEGKLLELSGLKEKQSYIAQLQRDLQAKITKINRLNMAINLFQAERKELQEEIKQNLLAKNQLEIAKKKIIEMEAKTVCNDANQMKGQLMMLKEQVSGFQREETHIRDINALVEKKLKDVKYVELEVVEMKRRDKELQLEKRELSVKLVAAEARMIKLSNKTESQIIAKVEGEISSLRRANEQLSKQVEKLQKSRFGRVEELVYQKWINSCLKFELQDYKTPSRNTPKRNLGNSSHSSSAENYETDSTTIFSSSSSSQRSSNKKSSLIQKIKKWGRNKDDSSVGRSADKSFRRNSLSSRPGLIRRFSTSMIPSSTSINSWSRKKEVLDSTSTESPETPIFPRVRRVSFNDSVMTFTFHDTMKSVEEVLDDEINMSDESLGHGSIMKPVNSNEMVEAQMGSEIKVAETVELHNPRMPVVLPSDNKIGTRMVKLVIAFFFFLLLLLVYTFLT